MAEVLNQSQIDALLNSISSGETVEKAEESEADRVKDYDFYSPKKFTKEQLRTIDSLHENIGRLLSSYLSGILRVFCEAEVIQVEEQRYYEYNNALPDTALIGLIDLKPNNINLPDSTLMLDMSNNLSYFLIDRLLGGPGSGAVLNRDFTDIELAIMDDIYLRVTDFVIESWKDHLDVEGELSSLETNPRLIQVYAPEDIVVICVLNVKLRDTEGTLSVCIPAMGLENYLSEFTSKYARISHKITNERLESMRRAMIKDSLSDTDLTLTAIFDETTMEIREALRLRPNDIIPLTKPLDGIVKVAVDNTPWFTAQLGSSRNWKAIKILEIVQGDTKDNTTAFQAQEMDMNLPSVVKAVPEDESSDMNEPAAVNAEPFMETDPSPPTGSPEMTGVVAGEVPVGDSVS
ncbi:flagellar motor switch protein FliM [Ruminococcaceae bacterium OttesenSCG-928-I18]|nr:flagellar motor switch protein FliM [Ruminococcaceae bacterium OttesenSCG-928-I18]